MMHTIVLGFSGYLDVVTQNCVLLPMSFSLKLKFWQCEYLSDSIAIRALLHTHHFLLGKLALHCEKAHSTKEGVKQ